MNASYMRVWRWLAAMTLVGGGCGQILGLDEYVLVESGDGGAGGAGGSGPTCGDGILGASESCDDGNDASGDGCTSCMVDACYVCTTEVGTKSVCAAKTAGEACAAGLCDGAGQCVECLVDVHCGVDGYCFDNECKNCDDGTKNGDETDVDCGGAHCNACTNGKSCIETGDCITTFCTDGVCCSSLCNEVCVTCIYPGFIGECTTIDKYGDDPSYGMGEACLLAEGETCGIGTCLKAFGQPCVSNVDCATTRCADPDLNGSKTCVKNVGEPCTVPADCYTNICTNGLCAM